MPYVFNQLKDKAILIGMMLLLAAVVPGANLSLSAQTAEPGEKYPPARHFEVKAAVSDIEIDGCLNETAWAQAAIIPLLYEWSPGDNVTPPVKTECLVTFSTTRFYVAFRCFDPEPSKIRAHLMDRDAILTLVQDDHISIEIDSFNDERRAFQFRVNPLGVQADANFIPMEGYEDFSWDAIWDSAGRITDSGYEIEIAIPFNQFRFRKTSGPQTWGFSAERSYPRKFRHRISSHTKSRDLICLICQYNKLNGFEGIDAGRNIELDPTLTVRRTDQQKEEGLNGLETGKIKVEPGLTAKWGVTPGMILSAAVNPDFSHVEADVAQLEVNTRFALRYPEKRPFFLEGGDFFLTPLEAVFSRTVYDPVWGVKSTGKLGGNAMGFFLTQDRFNNLVFPSNQGSDAASLKENTYTGVLRYRRDIGKGSTIGALYTGRVSDDYSNHVAGLDGFFRLSDTKNLKLQVMRSQTLYPGEISKEFGQPSGTFGGNALHADFQHYGRHISYSLLVEDLDPGFRVDTGFIPRVDFRRYQVHIQPQLWGKEGGWFNRLGFNIRGEWVTDHSDLLTNRDFEVGLLYEGVLQSEFQHSFTSRKEYYCGITYDLNLWNSILSIRPMGGLDIYITASYGDTVDYDNARKAHNVMLNPNVEFGLGKHVNINFNHFFEHLSFDGQRIYTANLLQTRLMYNFNVRTFLRAIIQYTHINRNTAVYVSQADPLTKELFVQFLFSYKLNPQTVLFIGYSDNHSGLRSIPLTRTDRTFFLKIGYALTM